MRLDHRAHLLAEAVQVEQGLQVCALPLRRHVEVGQLRLEGPLCGREGHKLWAHGPSSLAPTSSCSSQLGRLLGQVQALAVLGLSGERRMCSQLLLGPPQRPGASTTC